MYSNGVGAGWVIVEVDDKAEWNRERLGEEGQVEMCDISGVHVLTGLEVAVWKL